MNWLPHDGPQTEFLSRGEFEVLFGGAAGPGKTDCLIMSATRFIQHSGYRALLLRRTFPQLQEIIDRCYQWYPYFGGVYRSTEHRWYFPSGATITLGHMQHEPDKYNYQGKEFHFVGLDELTQFLESQYLYMFSRIRTTDSNIPPMIRSTSNPGGIGHRWVKERFVSTSEPGKTVIDSKTGLSRCFIPGTINDNPTLFETDPGYLARLDALPELERMRLKFGIWDAFEGQVFTELSQRIHGCEPFEVDPTWEKICVMDWGFSKPFSVGWYAIDFDGVMYRYREWYGCKEGEPDVGLKMPAFEVARGIIEHEKEKVGFRVADPSIWHPRPDARRGESRGPTIFEDMAQEGIFFIRADNDRLQGKLQVHKRFRVEEEIDKQTGEVVGERPMFQAFNNQHHFWRCMMEMQEDPNNTEDVDTDQEDHVYDELRYMCMSRPIVPKKVEHLNPNSFKAERTRYIKAKQYAQRHGVSMRTAYDRVR